MLVGLGSLDDPAPNLVLCLLFSVVVFSQSIPPPPPPLFSLSIQSLPIQWYFQPNISPPPPAIPIRVIFVFVFLVFSLFFSLVFFLSSFVVVVLVMFPSFPPPPPFFFSSSFLFCNLNFVWHLFFLIFTIFLYSTAFFSFYHHTRSVWKDLICWVRLFKARSWGVRGWGRGGIQGF